MDMKKDNNKDRDDALDALQETFNASVPEELEKRLKKALDGFRQDLKEHPYLNSKKGRWGYRWRRIFPFHAPFVRFLLLTGVAAACVAVVMTLLFGNKSTTWADVEEHFRAIPFCAVSVYFGSPYSSGNGRAQYWISGDGRARIHSDDKVAFVDLSGGRRYLRTFNVKTRREDVDSYICKNILQAFERVKRYGKPTLKSIIEAMTGENMIDTTSLLVSDVEVSKDLLVFDAESYDTLWNIRVWALRESKLPIRILKWHRRYDRYEEVLFSYSKEQPKEFFNADAFEKRLKDPASTEHDLKYMFLQDPKAPSFPAQDN
jgi:hypothetical protein